MELRHLRYFVAVAEEGSLSVAAERRLRTAQPSLSRQIHDLEEEVGAPLFNRVARGVELTPAGQVFLDHARLILKQADAAVLATQRASLSQKPIFSMGFLTGQEVDWLTRASSILRGDLPNIEVRVVSAYSPQLGEELQNRRLDVAFLRREPQPDLEYRTVAKERFVVILPSEHPLAAHQAIDPRDLVGEAYIGMSDYGHVPRTVIERYLRKQGIALTPSYSVDNYAQNLSLVASTGGVSILPTYVCSFLSASLTSRPFKGTPPTIDLVVGYHWANESPILKAFLSRLDDLIADYRARH